jgi:hypothetical protein
MDYPASFHMPACGAPVGSNRPQAPPLGWQVAGLWLLGGCLGLSFEVHALRRLHRARKVVSNRSVKTDTRVKHAHRAV